MSVRRVDFARLESAGWTVVVDSPWRRLAGRLAALLVRQVVDSDKSTPAGPVSAGAARWSR
jgi:hypothetical protein